MKSNLIAIVNQIPSGKVVSYGQVAEQLCLQFDITMSGWLVGRMLSSMNQDERNNLPRQRVVNKHGIISSLKLGEKGLIQIALLKSEGVEVNNGLVDMKRYGFCFS